MEIVINAVLENDSQFVVTVQGAIDLASREQLLESGRTGLQADGVTALVLDLAGVTFIDSTGVGGLVELASDAADLGRGFVVRQPSDRVLRILTITGLIDEWDIQSRTPGQ